MITRNSPAEFLELGKELPIIDVRSEREYFRGHIPGAVNLPLFNDEERAVVGTLYKNSGRVSSVLKGLELAGPKLAYFVKQLHKITDKKRVLVHCWRGGMRSESMAWLFQVAGYEADILEGGYKSYRQFIRERLLRPANIFILGGFTGSGKTRLLHQLEKMGEQVLDLEKLACHKGSVFGGFGQNTQPTNEQFENDIFAVWEKLNHARRIWIEDESRMIGNVCVPDPLFDRIIRSVMIKIETPRELRIHQLVKEYAFVEKEDLKNAVLKIHEKMGGTNTRKAIAAIEEGDFEVVADLTLAYYDKSYSHSVLKRLSTEIHTLSFDENDLQRNASLILSKAESLKLVN